MSRTTIPTQPADEAQPETSQTQTQTQNASSVSLMPIVALVLRLVSFACLIVSTSLIVSNTTTIRGFYNSEITVHFSDIYAYRYVLATSVIGLAYTLVHLSFPIHQLIGSGKINHPLASHSHLLISEFIGDKVILSLLGTGVGAAFGATVDLKSKMDDFEDGLEEYLAITAFAPLRSKLDDFFNRAYFPAIFLLIAFLCSGISSVVSSLALMNKKPTN